MPVVVAVDGGVDAVGSVVGAVLCNSILATSISVTYGKLCEYRRPVHYLHIRYNEHTINPAS